MIKVVSKSSSGNTVVNMPSNTKKIEAAYRRRLALASDWVRAHGYVSICGLSRGLRLSMAEAAQLVIALERAGVVSPPDLSGARVLLASQISHPPVS